MNFLTELKPFSSVIRKEHLQKHMGQFTETRLGRFCMVLKLSSTNKYTFSRFKVETHNSEHTDIIEIAGLNLCWRY